MVARRRAIGWFIVFALFLAWLVAELNNPRDCYDPANDTRYVCDE